MECDFISRAAAICFRVFAFTISTLFYRFVRNILSLFTQANILRIKCSVSRRRRCCRVFRTLFLAS